jgi:hypothetical protein
LYSFIRFVGFFSFIGDWLGFLICELYPTVEGVFYFQESKDDASSGGGGALEATWAVLCGSAALAAVLPAKLKVPSAHGTPSNTRFVRY